MTAKTTEATEEEDGSISFRMKGRPVPWARMGRNNNTGKTFVDPKKKAHKMAIARHARAALGIGHPAPIEHPCILFITFRYKVPKSWPKWKQLAALRGEVRHASKPDLDNLVKQVKDGLSGSLYLDDAQVCKIQAQKCYDTHDETFVCAFFEEQPTREAAQELFPPGD